MQKLTKFIYRLFDSTKFFAITLGLLVVQSVWLAFTAIYPLPFDEYFHLELIQIYAKQWLPFITQQPPEASILGDVTRGGSYLYHYLMSFPYRLLDTFIDSEMAMIISLRLINIAMMVVALILFRKLFIMWKIPRRVINMVFLLFVFTPIVPFLAAHINYDNLILIIMPTVMIFGTRLIVEKGDVAWNGLLYAIFGLAGLLVKETFVPLFIVISLYVLWRLWREHGKRFLQDLWDSIKANSRKPTYIIAAIVLVVAGGLVLELYGVNYVKYRSFIVPCDKVQPVEVCEDFGPWYRNQQDLLHKPTDSLYGNPLSFTQHWGSKIMRGYFVPFSHTPTMVLWDKEPFGPIVVKAILPNIYAFACIGLAAGLIAVALRFRQLLRKRPLRFAIVVCAAYMLAVWMFNYRTYLRLGEAEAIQARYFLPILPLIFLLMVKSVNGLIKNRTAKAVLVLCFALFYVWGGGASGWAIRSDPEWYWQNSLVQTQARKVQNTLKYLIMY